MCILTLESNSHDRGLRRLYLVPILRMRRPTMTKLAARMKVGLIIVVVILG